MIDPVSLQTLAVGTGAAQSDDPSQMSEERRAMECDIVRIADILDGLDTIRRKGTVYLPKYENEDAAEYNRRLLSAPWRPEFDDALRALRSKPFGKPVTLKGEPDEKIIGTLVKGTKDRSGGLVDDIDGRGNNLTTFAREAFGKGVAFGLHIILVDFPDMNPDDQEPDGSSDGGVSPVAPRVTTIKDETDAGVRPYWVHVPLTSLLACYTQMINGKETVVHLRFRETHSTRDGFTEKTLNRIRVLEPGKWELWEQQDVAVQGRQDVQWVRIDSGPISRGPNAETSIPVVTFFTGERQGEILVKPALAQLAHMQIELYRALSREDEILNFAGSPMLSAKGMKPPSDGGSVIVGPKRIMWAPEAGADWAYIQPAAANLAEIRAKIGAIQEDMRRVGMQPLVQPGGRPTATGQQIDIAQAHSVVKAWAIGLKDAIDQAFVYTAEWMGIADTITSRVSTEFSDAPDDARWGLPALQAARTAHDLSQGTFWAGLQRYNVLMPDFDPEAETEALAEEQQGLEPDEQFDPATGQPIEGVTDADMAALFHPSVFTSASPPVAAPPAVPPPPPPVPVRP